MSHFTLTLYIAAYILFLSAPLYIPDRISALKLHVEKCLPQAVLLGVALRYMVNTCPSRAVT